MQRPSRSTIRTTVLWTLIPAAILYWIALSWSAAEGISAKMVLRDLAQACSAPLGTRTKTCASLVERSTSRAKQTDAATKAVRITFR